MTLYFVPPVSDSVPPMYLNAGLGENFFPVSRTSQRLMSFFPPRPRGSDVFLLTDGSVTTNQPWPLERVAKWWNGGHVHVVSDFEAGALAGAGFTVTTTPPSDYVGPVPPPGDPKQVPV